VVFIFGMGRSGTSALARVLSLCGAALPQELLAHDEGNPRGYWEPLQALQLNDEFLFRHGATWFDPTLRIQDPIVFNQQERESYIDKIRAFFDQVCPGEPLIAIKEPRIAALAEYWFDGARRAGFAIKIVIPVRHPEEVAASLATRYQTSPQLSAALWLKYNLLAEAHSRRLPRIFVEYPNLLRNWRHEIDRISSALSIKLTHANASEIDSFLCKDLHREKTGGADSPVFDHPWVKSVYTMFSAAARDTPGALDGLDRIFSDYSACERMFRLSSEEFRARFGPPKARELATAER
jgi:hypothetical protein